MRKIILVVLSMLVLSGCYWYTEVGANQVAIEMRDGVSIDRVVGAGRYTAGDWYADIEVINVSSQTVSWVDPDLVTADKQPIGFDLAVTYARCRDSESIEKMWELYNAEARNNEALQKLVLTRIPRVAKAVTTEFTLDEMLGVNEGTGAGRTIVTNKLSELLESELTEIGVCLLDVGINNIAPSGDYLALIERKSNAQVAIEVAQAETAKLAEELKQEEAQTQIELERARRDQEVQAVLAETYDVSQRAYELRRLELLQGILGDNDKVYFIPEGSDLTIFLAGEGTPIVTGN